MKPQTRRLIVVLGYSTGRGTSIHPICQARLDRAAAVSSPRDLVLLSGWARHPSGHSEAALMRDAWHGAAAEVLLDEGARTTAENARHALLLARRLGVDHVVIVTSSWHVRRALAAFRWQRGRRSIVVVAEPAQAGSRTRAAYEWLLVPLLPLQVLVARCRVS